MINYRLDFEKNCLLSNFNDENKYYRVSKGNSNWNFFWCSVSNLKEVFHQRLDDDQMINHFPNHYELTNKDNLVKNIKRYERDLLKKKIFNESNIATKSSSSSSDTNNHTTNDTVISDIIPPSFMLPNEYPLFLEYYKKNPSNIFITKPPRMAQGKGITIITKLSQIRKYSKSSSYYTTNKHTQVISKYIHNPLLIGGKKFDLRLYVLVTNYKPLKIYLFQDGFTRFCNVKYSNSKHELNNNEIHLTNVAIQKHGEYYNHKHGNKWSIKCLELYIESTCGYQAKHKLFNQINQIIIHSLKSVQNVIINDKHCFECYGYDIIIDNNLKPWLIEVNASPSLSSTTPADRVLKTKLIADLLKVVIPPNFPSTTINHGSTSWNKKKQIGRFKLIYNENDINQHDQTLNMYQKKDIYQRKNKYSRWK